MWLNVHCWSSFWCVSTFGREDNLFLMALGCRDHWAMHHILWCVSFWTLTQFTDTSGLMVQSHGPVTVRMCLRMDVCETVIDLSKICVWYGPPGAFLGHPSSTQDRNTHTHMHTHTHTLCSCACCLATIGRSMLNRKCSGCKDEGLLWIP